MKREVHISGSKVDKFGRVIFEKRAIDLDYIYRIYTKKELDKYLQSKQNKKRGEQ